MSEGKVRYLNKGYIRGSIKYMVTHRNFLELLVITDAARKKAELWVKTFDTALLDGIRAGDLIELYCHIELRKVNKKAEDHDKNNYDQQIIADFVRSAKRALYYDAPEYMLYDDYNGGHPRDENTFQAAGMLMNVFSPNDFMSIATIKVADGNKNNRLNVSCYRRQNEFIKSMEKNAFVVVTGSMINGSVKPDGTNSEMFYCVDIARPILEDNG